MRLTNYWWLLIWLFAVGGLLDLYAPKEQVNSFGQTEERWKWLPAIILAAPYVIWTAYRQRIGDTELYRQIFFNASDQFADIFQIILADTKDFGFSVFTILFKGIFGNADILFFFVIAVFQMICLIYFLRKYSCNYWISFFLFIISTDYVSWMLNGMRQFIATALILLATDLLVKRKYGPMVALIVLAATFHGSALIMLPIMFIVQGRAWNRKTIAFMLVSMIAIFYVDRFTLLLNEALADTHYSDMVTNEIWVSDDGTNMFRVLVYSVPALVSILGIPYLRQHDNRMINICVNCSIVTMMIYLLSAVTSGIYIGRLPIYTTMQGYVALPWLLGNIFEKKSIRMVTLIMLSAYVAFFYYQMHLTWRFI